MSIVINELTDEEKYFLLDLSYIDISSSDFDKSTKRYSIADMLNHATRVAVLENDEEKIDELVDLVYRYQRLTNRNNNLNQIHIIGYENHNVNGDTTHDTKTGFVGYALEDGNGNRGFLFRGSEMGEFADWGDNINSGFYGVSNQIHQAREFFERYSSDDQGNPLEGITYSLYGHSKGSNLAAEVFVDNLNLDIEAYGVNGQPINWYLLNEEQREALRGDRYTFIVHGGDLVSALGYVDYVDKIVLIKKLPIEDIVTKYKPILYTHSLASAEFDENGSFISARPLSTFDKLDSLQANVATSIIYVSFLMLDARIFMEPRAIKIMGKIGIELYYNTINLLYVVTLYAYEKAVNKINNAVNKFIMAVSMMKALSDKLKEELRSWVASVVNDIKDFFSSISSLFHRDNSTTHNHNHSDIDINILELRNIASRLRGIQNRIVQVDRQLNNLAWLVDREQSYFIQVIGRQVGYDYELDRCMEYMHHVANSFEHCERWIQQRLMTY